MIFSLFLFSIYLRHDTISRSMDLGLGDFMFCFLLDIISSPSFFYFTSFLYASYARIVLFYLRLQQQICSLYTLAQGRRQRSSICCVFGSGRKTKRRGLHVTGVKMTPSVYIYYILFILQCQIIRKASRGRNYHLGGFPLC
ncbi:hypothetical protein HDV62DRAFT_13860 [Trichoderma sp. SZMC 28011]